MFLTSQHFRTAKFLSQEKFLRAFCAIFMQGAKNVVEKYSFEKPTKLNIFGKGFPPKLRYWEGNVSGILLQLLQQATAKQRKIKQATDADFTSEFELMKEAFGDMIGEKSED